MKRVLSFGLLILVAAGSAGCRREQRVFDPGAMQTKVANGPALNEVHAGAQHLSASPLSPTGAGYDDDAYAVGEGKRLFEAYNCVGCHQHGGGGIGPALMDSQWIYGSHSDEIYADIVEGRANGMPSFAGKIPEYQVWEIVAYVRSMSGQLREDVAPARSDHMPMVKAEEARPKEHPQDENQQKEQQR